MSSILSLPLCSTHTTVLPLQHALNSARCTTTSRTSAAAIVQERRPGSLCLGRDCRNDSTRLRRGRQPVAETHLCHSQAPHSSEASAADSGDDEEESTMPLSTFKEYVKLNTGTWGGHFHQFDMLGRTLQQIPTRLDAYSYGEGAEITLHNTPGCEFRDPADVLNLKLHPKFSLKIKEALSRTSIPGETDAPTWAELKLDPTNLTTIDRPQQIVYFPVEKAYCVSHQTAKVLDKVLRAGVLGEDDDEREDSPKGVKLPSRRPALVSESCLHSEDGSRRVRVFIVLDPRGLLDVIGYFTEKRIEGAFVEVPNDLSEVDEDVKVDSLVGHWAGPSVTRRTGIYGSTVAESDVSIKYEKLPGGFISQEFSSSRGFKVNLTGQIKGSVLDFDGGLQTVILPGGVAVSAPISVGRSVGRSQSFFFEFSWMQSPRERQRLVRTYDTDGLVVSTTWSSETKL